MTHQLIDMGGRIGFVIMVVAFATALCGHWDHLPWRRH